MANEVSVRAGLTVLKRSGSLVLVNHQTRPGAFTADMTGAKGPTPGSVTVSREGTTVDFAQLTTPGWVSLYNQDATYWVDWGVWNPESLEFYPVGRLYPAKGAVFQFSPDLRAQYSAPGTGTGTGAEGSSEFRLKAQWEAGVAGVNVLVEAFEA